MRVLDGCLILAIVAAGASGWRWFAARGTPVSTARPAGVTVAPVLAPDFIAPDLVDHKEPGQLLVQLELGESLTGISLARVFPFDGRRIAVERWRDVTMSQATGGLDMRHWLYRTQPSGEHAMLLGLNVLRGNARETRIAWLRFRPGDLQGGSLCARAPRRETTDLLVVTEGGQPVPAARVAVHPRGFRSSEAHVPVFADDSGRITISGITETWRALLPDGVGPSRTVVAEDLAPGEHTRLVVPLGGRWHFAMHAVALPFRGATTSVAVTYKEKLHPAAWPVSRWIGAGRGTDTVVPLMIPERIADKPLPGTLQFRGLDGVQMHDLRKEHVVVIDRNEKVTARRRD